MALSKEAFRNTVAQGEALINTYGRFSESGVRASTSILNLMLMHQLGGLEPGQLASMFERAVIAMEKSAAAQERTAAALEKIASPQANAFSLPPSPKQGQTS